MKIALVHDFINQLGGAERVLDAFLELFPDAPVYTLVYDPEKIHGAYKKFNINTSFIQKMPFGKKKYKWYLPLMPKAIESFNLSDFDIVLSDSSAYAKGVKVGKKTCHICYLHTPTRYLWFDKESYLKTAPIPFFVRPLMPATIKYLRKWDLRASKNPNYLIANSENTAQKTREYYHRNPDLVIWPPVDCKKFNIAKKIDNYFLVVGRMEPYKKTDLVIDAFIKLGLPLKVVGIGSKQKELAGIKAKNIEFVGRVSDEKLAEIYSRAQALIFPQREDAGITPLEAMASGRPVLAYKAGGATEIVKPGVTGEFFTNQTVESIIKAVKAFGVKKYDPKKIRDHALKYDKEEFKKKILNIIKQESKWN